MSRMRGVGNRIILTHPPRERSLKVPVKANFYICTKEMEEMQLSEIIEDSFLLPPHVLEARFHLPLHPFFYSLLNDYKITPGQILGFF
ncbi:hypothetical protein PVK06_002665 [Gossypium arboreum]|uniref:Uncharacterized protein n=1 Tax=Gossypium arboreum TaxID=29729 RepID=A0ABR0R5D9_GOSAR|nr:hypothetical protein PVK06_002665 [Gossypium arboreum]